MKGPAMTLFTGIGLAIVIFASLSAPIWATTLVAWQLGAHDPVKYGMVAFAAVPVLLGCYVLGMIFYAEREDRRKEIEFKRKYGGCC